MSRRRNPSVHAVAVMFLLALCPMFSGADAQVERIEITSRETVADGHPFGLAGPYEKIVGRLHFALDPEHPANRMIVDLDKASPGEDGKVRFWADLYLLRPVHPDKGNGTVLLEVPNRGGKASVFYFNRNAGRTRDPETLEDFGDGFLMRRGFTVAWVGWQFDVPDDPSLLRIEVVPAVSGDGAIEGLARADHVFSEPSETLALGHRDHRPYPVADPDDPRNVLTVRDERLGERRVIPREGWRFAASEDGGDLDAVSLEGGFVPGKIYEVVWVTEDPVVVGLGLASIRDAASWLKHGAGSVASVDHAFAVGISQTGRFLRHFLWQGFNEDVEGRPALDGVLAHTAGAGRGSFNHRFGQPSRDAHPFSAFFYPTDVFPFTGRTQEDQVSSREDGLLRRLRETDASPKIFFTNTGYEYWGRAASLIHTTVAGEDLDPLPHVRIYHLAGAQHFVDRFPPEARATRHPANPLQFLWAMRAHLVNLEAWVAHGTEPPPSLYPKVSEGTLVEAPDLAFPSIPGVEAPEVPHLAYRMDYGPKFWSEGIVTKQPPGVGEPFPVKVPQVDEDGNELGGLRLPELAVPLATYTPWNYRAKGIGNPDQLADFRGAFLAFPATKAEREETGDPRPSVEDRYANRAAYLGEYAQAAVDLVERRYLLAEDLPEMLERAGELWGLVVGRESE